MIKLNLTTENNEQERIKEYLENNVNEILATKINNGVKISKDNKTLLNKKDLTGFWNYATNEARKLTTKTSSGTYVDDKVVYGWAMHYFEEDSIEGKLYNEDGTEYKTITKTASKPTPKPEPKKEEKSQQSLFDLMTANPPKEEIEETKDTDDEEFTENEKDEVIAIESSNNINSFYKQYSDYENCYPDTIIISKLGDFYEAFNDNANILSQELDLTAIKQKINNEDITMAGFPNHVKEKYINILTKKYSVLEIDNQTKTYHKQKETNNMFDNSSNLFSIIAEILDNKVVLQ